MSLSCYCGDTDEYEWLYSFSEDFVRLNTTRRKRCSSCGILLNIGSECLKFYRERKANSEIEERIYGDMVPLAPLHMCGECSEIFLNLDAVGYCLDPTENMHSLLREYHELTGFKPSA